MKNHDFRDRARAFPALYPIRQISVALRGCLEAEISPANTDATLASHDEKYSNMVNGLR